MTVITSSGTHGTRLGFELGLSLLAAPCGAHTSAQEPGGKAGGLDGEVDMTVKRVMWPQGGAGLRSSMQLGS